MPRVKLPNGQALNFPDDTPEHVMREAIQRNFPEYAPKYGKQDENQKRFNDAEQHRSEIPGYLKEIPISLAETGAGVHNALGHLATYLSGNKDRNKYDINSNFREMMGGVPEEKRNIGHSLASVAPELLASLIAPEVGLPKLATRALGKYGTAATKTALTQGGVAAAFNPENAGESGKKAAEVTVPFSLVSELTKHGNPYLRKAARAGLAIGAGALGHQAAKTATDNEYIAAPLTLASAGLAYRPSMTTLARKIEENRVNPKLENKLMQAGERLGLTVGPHEANPTYPMGVIKGGIGKSPEGASLAVIKGNQRFGQEEKAIEKLFKDMSPPEQELAKKNLYREAYDTKIPEDVIKPFKENENIKKAILSVEKQPEFREEFKNIKSKDSLEYWDLVKRALDARIDVTGTKVNGELNTIGRLANKSKNALIAELDKVAPQYKDARNFAQKEIVTDDLKHFFNKRKLTANNLTKALDNKSEFSNLLKVFKDKPEVRQQIIDWKRLSEHLHSNIPNAKAGAKLEATNLNKERSSVQKVGDYFNKTLNQKYDKAAIELMANPKWRDEVHKLSQVTNNEKRAAKFIELLGKVSAQGIAKSNNEE